MAFRGTSIGQDKRFRDKALLVRKRVRAKAPKEYHLRISMAKVRRDVVDAWVSERLTNFKMEPEVAAMVGRLQAAGYATGILTNGNAEVLAAC